ncbi:MAG: azurin [Bacteroidota bacterium]|jgi:azurin
MKKLLLVLALVAFGFTSFAQTKITVESNDQMKYNVSQIKVKAGESVTLTLKHVGKMPIQAMGHNLVILQKGTDIVEFARLASTAKGSGYVPAGSKAVIAATKLIGGGQISTITFKAPAKGTYDFICTFPGHFSMMKGKLIVE